MLLVTFLDSRRLGKSEQLDLESCINILCRQSILNLVLVAIPIPLPILMCEPVGMCICIFFTSN